MSTQWLQFLFEDAGTGNSGKNYGPYNVNPVNKLLEVEVRGAIVFSPTTATSTSTFLDYVTWGIQYGAAGFTPAAIDAASNNPNVLVSEVHVPDEIVIDWAPSTDTAAVIVAGPLKLTWRGQRFIDADTDFYFQTKAFIAGGNTWAMYGSFDLRFT